jgi:hypothetical protein
MLYIIHYYQYTTMLVQVIVESHLSQRETAKRAIPMISINIILEKTMAIAENRDTAPKMPG